MRQVDHLEEDAHFMEPTTAETRRRLLLLPTLLLLSVLTLLALPPGFPLHPLAIGLTQQVVAAVAPTATPALPLSARELYLDVDAPWSQVTMDGRKISTPVSRAGSPLGAYPWGFTTSRGVRLAPHNPRPNPL